MLEFLEENSLLCSHQSGFCSSGSCQSQLLSIVHDIYDSFDQSPTLEVTANFLDISKHSIKYGMRGYYSNFSVLKYQEIS